MLLRMGIHQPQRISCDAQQADGEELLFILGLFVCFMVGLLFSFYLVGWLLILPVVAEEDYFFVCLFQLVVANCKADFCLLAWLFVYLLVCLFICLFVCLFVFLSVLSSFILQYVEMPIVSRPDCQEDYSGVNGVDDGMICGGIDEGGTYKSSFGWF